MRRAFTIRIIYDTEGASKRGILHVISEIDAVIAIKEIKTTEVSR